MKKLISLLEANVTVSSLGLSNTTTDNDGTSKDLISPALLNDINTAAKNANLKVIITTAVSDHRETTSSGNPSRHTTGSAVDVANIDGVSYNSDKTKFTQLGNTLVAQLKSMGYDANGSETGHPKAVLWQVANHLDHVHVSNTTGAPSTPGTVSASGNTSTATTTDSSNKYRMAADSIFTDALTTGINKLGIQTESRLDRDINKIKKLLK